MQIGLTLNTEKQETRVGGDLEPEIIVTLMPSYYFARKKETPARFHYRHTKYCKVYMHLNFQYF